MRIKEMLSQHRRDFVAIYECESCLKTEEKSGHDDYNFHENVIPRMECTFCGQKSPSSYIPQEPKYPPFEIV